MPQARLTNVAVRELDRVPEAFAVPLSAGRITMRNNAIERLDRAVVHWPENADPILWRYDGRLLHFCLLACYRTSFRHDVTPSGVAPRAWPRG